MGELVMAVPLVAGGLKIASGIGQAQSEYLRSMGEAASLAHRSEEAARAARAGRVAAAQTDSFLRDELHTTLANISAIRASSGVGTLSPTTDAIGARERRVSDRERAIRVGNYLVQAESDTRAANQLYGMSDFTRLSARRALNWGVVRAVGDGFSAIAPYAGTGR